MRDANRQLLISAARLLTPLLEELVFVGGCVTGLLITDDTASSVRQTVDVDAIAEIVTYPEYSKFAERLRAVNFTEDSSEGAPLCRWRNGKLILDVMPLNPKILGFSNCWYQEALDTAETRMLAPSLTVRSINAPLFLATKLEAFKGRGRGDYLASHDIEDALSVIDGRAEVLDEVARASDQLRVYLAHELSSLLQESTFVDSLAGHQLPDEASQLRIPQLLARIQRLAGLK